MLVTCQRFCDFYLGWSGSVLQIRTNIIKVGSKLWLILTCSSNITLSLPIYNASALQIELNFHILVCCIFVRTYYGSLAKKVVSRKLTQAFCFKANHFLNFTSLFSFLCLDFSICAVLSATSRLLMYPFCQEIAKYRSENNFPRDSWIKKQACSHSGPVEYF